MRIVGCPGVNLLLRLLLDTTTMIVIQVIVQRGQHMKLGASLAVARVQHLRGSHSHLLLLELLGLLLLDAHGVS